MVRLPLLASYLLSTVTAIATVHTKGSKFFTSDGNQWYVKGIAYQLIPSDPLVDGSQCQRDANLMKTLGTNALRVYHVDPSANHKPCMDIFAAAGIYLFIDLDTFDTQIEQINPQWTARQLQAFQKVMDTFSTYDNVAGFFIGNEVLTTPAGTPAAPYVKAAVRDLKAYRDSKSYRKIPIGYSAADIASSRPMLQNYLACGSNATAIDFFALNAYEWCGESSYATSGYATLTSYVKNYNIPIFFSETGCITARPRTFGDMSAIYGSDMTPYWSGSIVYEWIEEANNYGIISYGAKVDPSSPGAPPDGFPRSGTPNPVQPDFDNLKKQWAAASPSSVKEADYTPSNSAPACPDRTSGMWEVDPKAALPAAPSGASSPSQQASGSGTRGAAASGTATGTSMGSRTAGTATISLGTSAAVGAAAMSAFGLRTTISLGLLMTVSWTASSAVFASI